MEAADPGLRYRACEFGETVSRARAGSLAVATMVAFAFKDQLAEIQSQPCRHRLAERWPGHQRKFDAGDHQLRHGLIPAIAGGRRRGGGRFWSAPGYVGPFAGSRSAGDCRRTQLAAGGRWKTQTDLHGVQGGGGRRWRCCPSISTTASVRNRFLWLSCSTSLSLEVAGVRPALPGVSGASAAGLCGGELQVLRPLRHRRAPARSAQAGAIQTPGAWAARRPRAERYWPLMVISPIAIVGDATEARNSRSLPSAAMLW